MKHFYKTQLDLLFSLFIAVFATASLTFLPTQTGVWRTVFVLLVALLIPGYLFTLVMFPKQQQVDPDQRLALSLGFSIFFVVLLGLALNYTPWGIRTQPTMLALLALIVLLSLSAWLRRLALPQPSLFQPQVSGRNYFLALGAAMVVLVLADFAVPTRRYTEFYILGSEARLDNYPRTLAVNESFALTLGVINQNARAQSYRAESRFIFQDTPSATTPPEAISKLLLDIPTLEVNEPWESDIVLTAPASPGTYQLELYLYQARDRAPYRTLSLLLEVAPSTSEATPSATLSAREETQ